MQMQHIEYVKTEMSTVHKHLPDNRSGSKESFARAAEIMTDPIKGSMFHIQFKCRT